MTMPGWWGNGNNTSNQATYDDVYLAIGPNAAARVEIGDAPTYAASKRLAIMTPQSWSNGTITATVRMGPFKPSDTLYLFVVDASNVPSAGIPVIPCTVCPNPTDGGTGNDAGSPLDDAGGPSGNGGVSSSSGSSSSTSSSGSSTTTGACEGKSCDSPTPPPADDGCSMGTDTHGIERGSRLALVIAAGLLARRRRGSSRRSV